MGPETSKLASLGATGKHLRNAQRDLFRFVKLPLKPVSVKTHCRAWRWGTEIEEECDMPCVSPFELIAYLWNVHGIKIEEDEVQSYWRHMRGADTDWVFPLFATNRCFPYLPRLASSKS